MTHVTNRDQFFADELVRYYESQRHRGEDYLKATLRIWRDNSRNGRDWKGYKMAVDRIEGGA